MGCGLDLYMKRRPCILEQWAARSYWRKGLSKEESFKSGAILAAGVIIADLARQVSSWDLPVRMIRHSVFIGSYGFALMGCKREVFLAALIAAGGAPFEDLGFYLMHGQLPQNYKEIPAPIRVARIFLVSLGFLHLLGVNYPMLGYSWKATIAGAVIWTATSELGRYARSYGNG